MASSPLSQTRFKIIFGFSWLIAFADFGLVLRWFDQPWAVAIIDSSISTISLLLLSLLIINTLRFYTPKRERYLNIFTWCLFLMGIWLTFNHWLLLLTASDYDGYKSFLNNSMPVRGSIALLILGCVALISVIWYNSEEQKQTEQRKTDAEKLAKEAELFKLRQQLQPHFLFNSLNSINALIGMKPTEARKMIQELSDFLRGTMRREENQLISFSEELEYLKLYLEIEKVRFGYRLKTKMDISEDSLTWKIPSLLIQPLMENAIKFGLYGTTGEVEIALKASISNKNLVITVENPFDPDMQLPEGTGFGLNSVKRRLYLLFARNDLVEINKEQNFFVITIRIPETHE
ncbi:MAG TPA: histidine kinase [Chitinophagaceae bacterium]|nr:histidine kinase [Chitinophagaceae bacterium]